MSHCPWTLFPEATAEPSLRISTVWCTLAETWVYETPWSKGGMSHCRLSRIRQATALPSPRRITECPAPAETWVYDMPSSKGGMLHCPPLLGHRFGEGLCGPCQKIPLQKWQRLLWAYSVWLKSWNCLNSSAEDWRIDVNLQKFIADSGKPPPRPAQMQKLKHIHT